MHLLPSFTFLHDMRLFHHVFPAQIWRLNDAEVSRTFATQKAITKIVVDPKLETADIDVTNNTWPKQVSPSKFD
jgi:hypothetical protein